MLPVKEECTNVEETEEDIVRNLSVSLSPTLNRKKNFEQYIRKKYLQAHYFKVLG